MRGGAGHAGAVGNHVRQRVGATIGPANGRYEPAIGRSVDRPWLGAEVTEAQLLVDIASGYDWLVLGADKWNQIREPHWYGSVAGRDAALARLPRLALVERHGHDLHDLPETAVQLVLADPRPQTRFIVGGTLRR